MAGDHLLGGGDAEQETDVERARVTHELLAGVRGLPPSNVPEALSHACVALLPAASGLSVSVLGVGSDLAVVLCASDDVAARLAEIQYTLGEGPGAEAVRLRAPVFAPDLTRPPDTHRWPLFSAQAAGAGAEAAFALPLEAAGGVLGTLDLYRETPAPLSNPQIRTALLVREAVTQAVLALVDASAAPEGVVTWPATAAASREEVHQATGMIMVQLGVGADEALLLLRARAFAQGRTSIEVARSVIDRSMDLRKD